jgi:hypothetical protein
MRRRAFLSVVCCAVAWPLAAAAQQSTNSKRLAIFSPSEPSADLHEHGSKFYRALFAELRRLGQIEGQNLVGRLRMVLVHDLPLQVVVDGVAARQVHAVWSGLDPWRGEWPPADVTACAGRRRVVADSLHGQSSSTTSIAPSFHGRREGTGELEPIAQVIVSFVRDI